LGVGSGEGGSDEVEECLREEGRGDGDESGRGEELEDRSERCRWLGMIDESEGID
jgi:hypothetical protein